MPKRKCVFNPALQAEFSQIKSTESNEIVFCKVCNSNFSIGNKGRSDIVQHLSSQKHNKAIRSASGSSKVSDFLVPKFTKTEE